MVEAKPKTYDRINCCLMPHMAPNVHRKKIKARKIIGRNVLPTSLLVSCEPCGFSQMKVLSEFRAGMKSWEGARVACITWVWKRLLFLLGSCIISLVNLHGIRGGAKKRTVVSEYCYYECWKVPVTHRAYWLWCTDVTSWKQILFQTGISLIWDMYLNNLRRSTKQIYGEFSSLLLIQVLRR